MSRVQKRLECCYVRKILRLIHEYCWDTFMDICVVLAFNAMELLDTLFFEISQGVEFQANKMKDHEKTKSLAENLSAEVD